MAITTLDGAIAGMQPPRFIAKASTPAMVAGRPQSLWSLGGSPGAGAYDATLNGVVLSSTAAQVAGQLPCFDPASLNQYLARFSATCTQIGQVLLLDRLWHNGGYNVTTLTAQSSTTPTWPARSSDGTTNGDAVLLAVEVSAATGAGTPTITISYTNQAGTAGRTATNIIATVATSAIGATYLIGLQAGDSGVRSVQSLTLSATWTSGTINLVAYRFLASVDINAVGVSNSADVITSGFPRLYNGTVPYLAFIPSSTAAMTLTGSFVATQG